jgi:hypothetical protein
VLLGYADLNGLGDGWTSRSQSIGIAGTQDLHGRWKMDHRAKNVNGGGWGYNCDF